MREGGGTKAGNPKPTMSEQVLSRVEETVKRFGMLAPFERVVVGCSGGADSTCLLHVLAKGIPQLSLSLVAVYVDHGLRKGTENEQERVMRLARACGAEYLSTRVDVPGRVEATGESVQEAARILRYQALRRVADEVGATRIAVGHTLTDQAETVLLQMLRGTGPKGLAGIAPVKGEIVRPLLGVSRAQTEGYCALHGLEYVDDPSNESGVYLRNRVRKELLPVLAGLNPGVERHLAQLADILREEDALIEAMVVEESKKLFTPVEGEWMPGVRVSGSELLRAPRGLARRLVRRAHGTVRGDERGLGFDHVERILAAAARKEGTRVIGRFGGVEVRNEYGELLFLPCDDMDGPDAPVRPPVRQRLAVPGETLVDGLDVTIRASLLRAKGEVPVDQCLPGPNRAHLDWRRVSPPLVVRSRLPGDRLQPAGRTGVRKVKDILIDAKVPRRLREKVPIVEDGEGIVWVVGYALAERVKVREESEEILCLRVDGK